MAAAATALLASAADGHITVSLLMPSLWAEIAMVDLGIDFNPHKLKYIGV